MTFLWMTLVVVVIVLTPPLLHLWLTARERRRHPAPGRLIDVGGRRLHLMASGPADAPAVVVETGRGHPAIMWDLVRRELGSGVRLVTYDRPGYGWSDPGGGPRSGEQVVDELHAALQAASIPGPYILVGHSLGGFYMRLFAKRFRDQVRGLILVDALHEDWLLYQPEVLRRMDRQFYRVIGLLAYSGLWRWLVHRNRDLYMGASGIYARFAPEVQPVLTAVISWPELLMATKEETSTFQPIGDQLRADPSLGDLPLTVLAADRTTDLVPSYGLDQAQVDEVRRTLWELNLRLPTLSTRGRLVPLAACGHNIPLERPAAVAEAIREML